MIVDVGDYNGVNYEVRLKRLSKGDGPSPSARWLLSCFRDGKYGTDLPFASIDDAAVLSLSPLLSMYAITYD